MQCVSIITRNRLAVSTKNATAEGAKATTVATGEHATADAPVEPETGFPLYAMRMRDFLELTRLEPHNTLAAKGLVVPVGFRAGTAASASTSCRASGSLMPRRTPRARI